MPKLITDGHTTPIPPPVVTPIDVPAVTITITKGEASRIANAIAYAQKGSSNYKTGEYASNKTLWHSDNGSYESRTEFETLGENLEALRVFFDKVGGFGDLRR